MVAFTACQTLLGYFVLKSAEVLWFPTMYGTKIYLHNHFKLVNTSFLAWRLYTPQSSRTRASSPDTVRCHTQGISISLDALGEKRDRSKMYEIFLNFQKSFIRFKITCKKCTYYDNECTQIANGNNYDVIRVWHKARSIRHLVIIELIRMIR